MYEFREKGIYYVNKDTEISRFEIRKAAREGTIEDHFDFVSYEDIKLFKVGFHAFNRTPVNGTNTYSVDFRIFTTWDEMIHIDVGILSLSGSNKVEKGICKSKQGIRKSKQSACF